MANPIDSKIQKAFEDSFQAMLESFELTLIKDEKGNSKVVNKNPELRKGRNYSDEELNAMFFPRS
jgi:hypothetical protein